MSISRPFFLTSRTATRVVGRSVFFLPAILSIVLLSAANSRAADGMIKADGLVLSVQAGSAGGGDWAASSVTALPNRPQTVVLDLKTRALHTFTRAIGDGEIPLAWVETSDTAVTRFEPINPVMPATRIPKAVEKLRGGEPLRVAALGTSLVEAGWAEEGWLRLLFGMGTEETRYRSDKAGGRGVVLSRYALGGSNARYTFGLLGEALSGLEAGGTASMRSSIYDNDLIIVGLLPNGGVDRLAVFEGVVRKLRAHGIEVVLVTDHAFAKRGEANELWRDGYFVRKMADRYGCALADTAAYMREAELRGETVYKDAIHANQAGYRLWAQAISGVLSPGVPLVPASGLDGTVSAARRGDTIEDAALVPEGGRVIFLPEHTGEFVSHAPDNRVLKAYKGATGGLIRLEKHTAVTLDRSPFMAVDLVMDASSAFQAEIRGANGEVIKTIGNEPKRTGTRPQVLTALSAFELKDNATTPTMIFVTSGELRLYAVVYQTREAQP